MLIYRNIEKQDTRKLFKVTVSVIDATGAKPQLNENVIHVLSNSVEETQELIKDVFTTKTGKRSKVVSPYFINNIECINEKYILRGVFSDCYQMELQLLNKQIEDKEI